MSDTKTFTTVVIYLSYYIQPFLDMLVWLRICGWELKENTHKFHVLLLVSRSWFTITNAFERSVKIAQTKLTLSKIYFHISSIFSKQCYVLWFLQNPFKYSTRTRSSDWTLFLKTLDLRESKLTGYFIELFYYFVKWISFFNKRTTSVNLIS